MRDNKDLGRPPSGRAVVNGAGQAVSALRASVPSAASRPVYEFRPHPNHINATVLRYADGEWLPDDGGWDVAFVSYGMGAPYGLYVRTPYQRNILWAGLTTHWRDHQPEHPRGNPWHYMLREGETEWGGGWGAGPLHLNELAGNAAQSKCCAINRCANGRGPQFQIGDPYIRAGLLRDRATKRIVTEPERLTCMYCGDKWHHAAQAIEARRAETLGSVHESAVRQDAPETPRGDA